MFIAAPTDYKIKIIEECTERADEFFDATGGCHLMQQALHDSEHVDELQEELQKTAALLVKHALSKVLGGGVALIDERGIYKCMISQNGNYVMQRLMIFLCRKTQKSYKDVFNKMVQAAASHAVDLAVDTRGMRVLLRIMEQCGVDGRAEGILMKLRLRSVVDFIALMKQSHANFAIQHAITHSKDREMVKRIVEVCGSRDAFLGLATDEHSSWVIRRCIASEHFTLENCTMMQRLFKKFRARIAETRVGKQSGGPIDTALSKRRFLTE